ncbi:purine-nucleoside phosphorylase [Paenibacillus spiritus]|uniref:Purine nucleoside phosphorylase n=1 Tax=Paenibacillus spiritus TaxID=2496557 RepID=A0A5J5GIW5_9BACL|nr:purine-nucleoside phosphorylase [Paenibacillus spiritus]KAA9007434.1 purine-nucleoside phosphorylase [Paenibacillus spiritus]
MTPTGNTPAATAVYGAQVKEAAEYIQSRLGGYSPVIGLILGSGLGDLGDQIEDAVYLPYEEIPHFPRSTVEGHAGRFVIGKLEGKDVIIMQGRFHYYEGYEMKKVVLPVYVMAKLGVGTLVITNAGGGMNRAFKAGDLMLITDHLNMTGDNPLIGPNDPELGVRFPDMSQAYDAEYIKLAQKLAPEIKGNAGESLVLKQGVYAGITGPTYETPAELKMLALLGGDAVGMSTVPEVIAASHSRLRVLGMTCITDMAIGDELEPLTHEQVVKVANETKPKFIGLVRAFVREVQV